MAAAVRPLKDMKGNSLQWVQPKLTARRHELRSGDDVFATLTWVKTFGSLAEAVTADGKFTLKRGGFVRPYVSIRDVAYDSEVAVLKIGLMGHGTIEFTNGRKITVLSTRFWSYEWDLMSEGGQLLCKVKKKVKVAVNAAEVAVADDVRKDRDLLLLIVMCWYAMVLISDEAAAAAGSVASNPAFIAFGVISR
jgi:hypothetical protein